MQSLLDRILAFEGIPEDSLNPAFYCSYCPKELDWSCDCSLSPRKPSKKRARESDCPIHEGKHEIQDCQKIKQLVAEERKRRNGEGSSSSLFKALSEKDRNDLRAKGQCFKCKKIDMKDGRFNPSHRCQKPLDQNPKDQGRVFSAIRAPLDNPVELVDPDECEMVAMVDETVHFSMTHSVDSVNSNHIALKVEILGRKILGYLDTEADLSFISPRLVRELDLPTTPLAGYVTLGQKGSLVPRQAQTIPVVIEHGKTRVSHALEVFDLSGDRDLA